MNVWEACPGNHHQILETQPWRIVEAQHLSSSRDLVDSLEEHDLLENLLETSKPSITNTGHYLIFTPFRYPPLKYGSRFGTVHEPSLWYGSWALETAFAEVSYYRLKFFEDSAAALGYIEIPMTAYQASLRTSRSIDLTAMPFNRYRDKISNPLSYEDSQILGSAMRGANTQAFIFYSARTKNEAQNIGVFTAEIFIKNKGEYIQNQQNWICLGTRNRVEFRRFDILKKERLAFGSEDFKK